MQNFIMLFSISRMMAYFRPLVSLSFDNLSTKRRFAATNRRSTKFFRRFVGSKTAFCFRFCKGLFIQSLQEQGFKPWKRLETLFPWAATLLSFRDCL